MLQNTHISQLAVSRPLDLGNNFLPSFLPIVFFLSFFLPSFPPPFFPHSFLDPLPPLSPPPSFVDFRLLLSVLHGIMEQVPVKLRHGTFDRVVAGTARPAARGFMGNIDGFTRRYQRHVGINNTFGAKSSARGGLGVAPGNTELRSIPKRVGTSRWATAGAGASRVHDGSLGRHGDLPARARPQGIVASEGRRLTA